MNKEFYVKWILLFNILAALFLMPAITLAVEPAAAVITTENNNDPLEPINRKLYQFNTLLDRLVLKPATQLYRTVIPTWGRARVACFLRNLATPVTFMNSVLQGDITYASTSFWRFTFNTTFGLGGLFDFAADRGLQDRVEDFGQTIGSYDIPSGPYLVLPFFGPSSLRDAAGQATDVFLDPFNYTLSSDQLIAREGLDTVESRSQNLSLTREIERTSLDPYATVRSLYLQSRIDLIHNGMNTPELDYPE